METTSGQYFSQLIGEAEQKWAAHHRCVNSANRLFQQERIDREGQARIEAWFEKRSAELGVTQWLAAMRAEANAAETDQPEPEPARIEDASPAATVLPGIKL